MFKNCLAHGSSGKKFLVYRISCINSSFSKKQTRQGCETSVHMCLNPAAT